MNEQFRKLRWALLIGCATALVAPATAAPFRLISVRDPAQAPPAGGSGDSWGPLITPDGRFVLFASTANNLVSSSNPMPVVALSKLNVFLRDRTNGTTVLASANLAGTGGGNGDSIPSGVSTNGRYALFESSASDLVPGDTNGAVDVFLRDMWSNTTVLVSVSTNGGVANGVCRGSTMTPDGRYVAFTSAANNLVPNDTNSIPDVFVRDLQGSVTVLASVGAIPTNRYFPTGSEAPDITPDGRYVAFYSTATNLVAGATNGGEIYVRDLVAGTTIWASVDARTLLGVPSTLSFNHAISVDGQFVVYEATSNPPPASAYAQGAILRFNLVTSLTDLVNSNAYVPTGNPEEIRSLDMSADGRFITFVANTNTGPPGTTCILLWDGQSPTTTLVSADLGGQAPADGICDWPSLTADGSHVAFLSSASGLTTNSLVGDYHLYLRDVAGSTTVLVDADTNGIGTSVSPGTAPHLNASAATVVFEAADNDRNHNFDVFLGDLNAGSTELLSAHAPAFGSLSPNGPSEIYTLPVSADGRFVAFTSDADNLVANDTNGFRDVFVRDLLLGTNFLVSVATNGLADGISSQPAISADGRYVAFTSSADNLVDGDTNGMQDVFIRDLQAGSTALVSVNTTGTGSGNGLSELPVVGAGGRFILFQSTATNIAAGPFNSFLTKNLFLRDAQAGLTYALTTNGVGLAAMTADGRFTLFGDRSGHLYLWDALAGARIYTNSFLYGFGPVALSPDGTRLAFFMGSSVVVVDRIARTSRTLVSTSILGSHTTLRFSRDGRFLTYVAAPLNTNQIYLYEFQTQANLLVSTASGSTAGASAHSDSADISADGRFVVYRSFATNLLASPLSNNVPNLFLYDRLARTTTLLSGSRYTGGPPDGRSLSPAFSGDGRTLVLQSWASDLVSGDFNQSSDIFALGFLYLTILPSNTPGQGPTLNWPARPGESYQVQFKNTLSDPLWQTVTGIVTLTGDQGQLTDLAPTGAQRFYRVVATPNPAL